MGNRDREGKGRERESKNLKTKRSYMRRQPSKAEGVTKTEGPTRGDGGGEILNIARKKKPLFKPRASHYEDQGRAPGAREKGEKRPGRRVSGGEKALESRF